MTARMFGTFGLLASIALGVAAGWLAVAQTRSGGGGDEAASVTGVSSGSDGSSAADEMPEGVNSVPIDASQAVPIEGVRGSDGTVVPKEDTVQGVAEIHGSVEAIRGIQGIDTVTLQNLEAVLRMQQRPIESEPRGGARSAAALISMENDEQYEFEETVDGRQEHTEFVLDGS